MCRPSDAPIRPARCDELVARTPSRTAPGSAAGRFARRVGVEQSDVSAAIIRGEHDDGMKFVNRSPTNVSLRVAELGRRPPGPRIRRLFRPVEGCDVSRKTTQENSDSDAVTASLAAFRHGGRDNELF